MTLEKRVVSLFLLKNLGTVIFSLNTFAYRGNFVKCALSLRRCRMMEKGVLVEMRTIEEHNPPNHPGIPGVFGVYI